MMFTLSINLYVDIGILTMDTSALLRLALFASVFVRSWREMLKFPKVWLWLMVGYLGICTITVLRTGPTERSSPLLFRHVTYIALVLVTFALVNTRERLRQVAFAISAAIVPIVLFAIVQVMAGGYTRLFIMLSGAPSTILAWSGRASSFLHHFNAAAAFINASIPYALLLDTKPWKKLALIGFGVLGVVLTQSRNGLLSSVCLLLLFALLIPTTRKRKVAALSAALAGALIVGFVALIFVNRFANPAESDDVWRVIYAALAIKMWVGAPLLGIGFDHFRFLKMEYVPITNTIDETYNVFLQVLVETGIVGFVVFFLLFWKALRASLQTATLAGKVVFISLFSVIVQGIVDCFFSSSPQYSCMFWTQIAMAAVVARLYTSKDSPPSQESPQTGAMAQ
jgi:O-antigen ligase